LQREERKPLLLLLHFDLVDAGVAMSDEQIAGLFRQFTLADAPTNRPRTFPTTGS
jgi:hypothetical protein